MSRAPNYEFQEWWNEQREKNQELFTNDTNNLSNGFLTVEISSPNLDRTAEKDCARSARQLSWVCLLRFQQLANSLAWITNAFILLLGTANSRIFSSDSSASRLYRIIKFFLFLVLLLLCVELVAYFKGWHISPPSAALAEAAVELVYAKWLEIRADYLAPPLQSLANLCIVLFLIQSVYRVVLMLGCFWIKFRRVKPTAAMEYPVGRVEGENVEDYPMVLVQIPMCNEREVSEANGESNEKRCKSTESNGNENGFVKAEEDAKLGSNGNAGDEKQNKTKPPEPHKDYIHVRARRGQATDSHSLAERVRREQISERMKLLQDLVPGCNKVTGKALMLDEIINYVQSLQRQVQFLSMKLYSVNTRLDFNVDNLMSKEHRSELANSQEESTVSEQNPNGDPGFKASKDSNSRKREAVPKAKTKETSASPSANAAKVSEANGESNEKRCKSTESNGNENGFVKGEEDTKLGSNGNAGNEKQNKTKPPEPHKDYIHVRARRGQASDSHSLAERIRREKISERMKLLQDLVPGCNKVTGKALLLDEIINYVQSLQRQVEFLSMKLVSVNTRLDFNLDNLMSKEIFQSNNTVPHPIFPIDSSASALFGHQPRQNPALHSNISNETMTQCSVDPLDAVICPNLNTHLPPINQFTETVPQGQIKYPT